MAFNPNLPNSNVFDIKSDRQNFLLINYKDRISKVDKSIEPKKTFVVNLFLIAEYVNPRW